MESIVQKIRQILLEQSPITRKEIVSILVKTFPEREVRSIKNTLNIQLINRINAEADFTVKRVKNKWYISK